MTRNFKSLVQSERTFLAGLLCLVGIVAFMLGQSSVTGSVIGVDNVPNSAGIVFTEAPAATITTDAVPVVASSGGTRYHLLTCSSANSIQEKNKVFFDSIDLALAAGYQPARNCQF
jgi:hypothetical protein